jgi:hypothetical protein
MNWSVTADTRAAAIEQLRAEDIRRAQSQPGYIVARQEALSRHLTDPIPGVYAIPMRVAERFMGTPASRPNWTASPTTWMRDESPTRQRVPETSGQRRDNSRSAHDPT